MSSSCRGFASFQHRWLARLATLAAAGLVMTTAAAQAAVITDATFFSSFPATLITFETNGAGSPVSLIDGETMPMPANEYAGSGVTFTSPINWVNDGNAALDAGQAMGGSPENSIPSSTINQFEVRFSVPVFAVGFWVVNNRTADPLGPMFTALAADGSVIEVVQFGSLFIDGTITNPNTTADYGFMGILSDKPIAGLIVTKQAAILDDLRHSPVPTPGALALLAMGGALIWRRKRTA